MGPPVKIVDVREIAVPLEGDVANALVSFRDHTVSLVAIVSDRVRAGRPVIGFGFNSIGRFAQSGIIRERLLPRLHAAPPERLLQSGGERLDPEALARIVMQDEKPGGHGDRAGAVAALELALWDLQAKLADEPAWATIARRYDVRSAAPTAAVYAAGGYYRDGDDTRRLREELSDYRQRGFEAFKIKVGGAPLQVDLARIEAAIEVAGCPGKVAVDANGRFGARDAAAFARAISGYGLRWFEEPGDPLDFELLGEVTAVYPGAVATGENLFSASDVRNLVRYGGMRGGRDIFQMDPGLSYGIGEYVRMLDALEAHGHDRSQCFPHGGHLINLHVVAGLGLGGCEAYPGVFQPFGGYSQQCLLEDGRVGVPDAPGFGLESKDELRPLLEQLERAS